MKKLTKAEYVAKYQKRTEAKVKRKAKRHARQGVVLVIPEGDTHYGSFLKTRWDETGSRHGAGRGHG